MQAIEVNLCNDSEGLPYEYRVFCQAKKLIFHRHDLERSLTNAGIEISDDRIAQLAAERLCMFLDWTEKYYGKLVMAHTISGWVFVFTGKNNENVIK